MSDDAHASQAHRRLIAERLRTGALPGYGGQRTFGGPGEGMPCACCDEPISRADVQYDVDHREAQQLAAAEQVRSLPMHLHCYRLWVEESSHCSDRGQPGHPGQP
ncbi:MAG TPA: hypothetical protein VN660_06525 [Steroidobacteraceae bacterium]|nr:hypothetical protein [Steroidobacteraceae bacterium]